MADIMNTTLGFQIAKVNLVEVVILTHLCHYIMQLQHFLRYTFIKKEPFNVQISYVRREIWSVGSAEDPIPASKCRISQVLYFQRVVFPRYQSVVFSGAAPQPWIIAPPCPLLDGHLLHCICWFRLRKSCSNP